MRPAIVFVVDDDASMRTALVRLLKSARLRVMAFASAEEFLKVRLPDEPSCLLLDVRMPGMSGLELQQRLLERSPDLPVIFITGHGDIRMAVRTIQAGAVEFLPKPFKDKELLSAVESALGRSEKALHRRRTIDDFQRRLAALTPREREVLEGVVAGKLNKQIGATLGITEKTVKVHRAKVMEKMGAGTVADLARMVAEFERLSVPRGPG